MNKLSLTLKRKRHVQNACMLFWINECICEKGKQRVQALASKHIHTGFLHHSFRHELRQHGWLSVGPGGRLLHRACVRVLACEDSQRPLLFIIIIKSRIFAHFPPFHFHAVRLLISFVFCFVARLGPARTIQHLFNIIITHAYGAWSACCQQPKRIKLQKC